MKRIKELTLAVFSLSLLTGCGGTNNSSGVKFTYQDVDFTPLIGSATNNETYDYNALKVNPISNIRDDFAMGVDASMVQEIESLGGKYFNSGGQEQDVFQILADNGVNFFRVRLWNNPMNAVGDGYGGGNTDARSAIAMSKRAQAAGLNVLVDFHYSDFWADPDQQRTPTKWMSYDASEVEEAVKSFTKTTLNQFHNAGVKVNAIQVGNEINNGMLYPYGKIDWNDSKAGFDQVADFLKAGIAGAKEVDPDIYTVIHLANGGAKDEFDVYFSALTERKVPYDIIGVSYYPYYHGTLEALKSNLDNLATKFKKPIMIMEMSYGYTTESNAYTANTYNSAMEDAGKYLTSIQGQATAIHDVSEILANVPNNLGLGIFYWEPGWLPIEGAGWATAEGQAWAEYGDGYSSTYVSKFSDGLATWSNQGLFSYTGKVLPSLATFKLMRGTQNTMEETVTRVRSSSIEITLNIAEHEQMPTTYSVETNFDAIRQAPVSWNTIDLAQLEVPGNYVVRGTVNNTYSVSANVNVIENYIRDGGFENQGDTDQLLAPWIIASSTPEEADVVKLNRKPQDVRSGISDLNWYHSSAVFTFDVKQEINSLPSGTYSLKTYIMAVAKSEIAHDYLDVYIEINGVKTLLSMKDKVIGWGTPENYYILAQIDNISIQEGDQVSIGIQGQGQPGAWGHSDDWSLVKVN